MSGLLDAIANALKIKLEQLSQEEFFESTIRMAAADTSPFAEAIRDIISQRYMRGVSVKGADIILFPRYITKHGEPCIVINIRNAGDNSKSTAFDGCEIKHGGDIYTVSKGNITVPCIDPKITKS